MLRITAIRSGWCVMALALSACSFMWQPAAPSETGAASASNTTTTDTSLAENTSIDNPYGSAPYTPPGGDKVVYTPSSPATGGAYVPNYAPVDINAATYTVQHGDTVYNIAKRFNISQNDLRSWNNIVDNNVRLGVVLRVKPAGYVAPPASRQSTTSVTTSTVTTTVTQPQTSAYAVSSSAPVTTSPASSVPTPPVAPAATASARGGNSRMVNGIEWQSPTKGSILTPFSSSSKGIDYSGNAGQPILAAAAGKVVYAGSGLRGYGNLVIIQHNQTYLTAYGHNQSLLVKEGEQVKRGQQIATMGNTDAKRIQLHFELRENGTPQDPNRFLP